MTNRTYRCAPLACLLLSATTVLSGCYHFSFELPLGAPAAPPTVVYTERVPTYVNGFVGMGRVDVSRYCNSPIRTELRVTAADVFLSVITLLIYTPHTLSVTCPAPRA
jgi:hypothetical protein